MRFRSYDKLRNFCLVAHHSSFTRAAEQLNLTKGAICHQIDKLEAELGFELFSRRTRGIELTAKGRKLLRVAELGFESIERDIEFLQPRDQSSITIGMATYFASRWLSPRLMGFITQHANIGLRLQPMIGMPNLRNTDLDMAIRWGKGEWHDPGMAIELIFSCPAVLTANRDLGSQIEVFGIEAMVGHMNLLHDTEGSEAWADWFLAAGLAMQPATNDLLIPDPNVRVQAVIDGQGVGLYDALVDDEVEAGKLYRYETVQLKEYGYYLVYPLEAKPDSPIRVFRDWIMNEAR